MKRVKKENDRWNEYAVNIKIRYVNVFYKNITLLGSLKMFLTFSI